MTFSMCFVRSASRCSMWPVSVQMRLATSCSSKSARCMKAEKLSPSPTGSMIVKRTLPGGMAVNSRSMALCMQIDRPGPARAAGLQQQQRTAREGQHDRQRELGLRGPKPLVLRHAAGDVGQLHLAAAEGDRRRDGRRRRPAAPIVGVPIGKRLAARPIGLGRPTRGTARCRVRQRSAISFHWRSNRCWLSSSGLVVTRADPLRLGRRIAARSGGAAEGTCPRSS